MNICVTGGAGYIGSVLTERLLNLGHKVTVVDTFLHGYHGILPLVDYPALTIIKRDIRDSNRDYLARKEFVFHLAALTGIEECEENKQLANEVNKIATAEIAKNLDRDTFFVFTSSTAIYGDQQGNVVSEDDVIVPGDSFYCQTKLIAERLIDRRHNTIVLRLATIYGLSSLLRPHSIVNDFIRKAVQEKKIGLYEATTIRPYMFIKDCVEFLVFTMEHASEMNGGCYNVGQENLFKRDLIDDMREHVDFKTHRSNSKSLQKQDFRADFSKIDALGFECKFSLFDGIRWLIKLYSFYRP